MYNVLLLIAFLTLSMLAMRLKLFLTPQMCILVSLLASDKVRVDMMMGVGTD